MVVHDAVVIMALSLFFSYILDNQNKWAGFIGYLVTGGVVLAYNSTTTMAAIGFLIMIGSVIKLMADKR